MKKSFISLFAGFLFLCFFITEKGFSEKIDTAMDKAILNAWGNTLTKIIEEKTNTPASSAAKIAGYISAGDYQNGLSEFFKLANDVIYSQIPVIGPAKFIVELESTLINVWKQYIDWYLISRKWSYFKSLSDSEKEQWLKGYIDIPELEFGGGAGYLVNNKYNIKNLFGKYWDSAKNVAKYMDGIKQIGEIFEKAKYLSEPFVSSPEENSVVELTDNIAFYPMDNNFLRFILILPDGKTSSINKKITHEQAADKLVKIKLSEFEGINWDKYYSNTSNTKVQIKVQAAIWDSSGIVEAVMGSSFVSPKEKILMNIPDQISPYVEDTFSFYIKSKTPDIENLYMKLNLHYSYKMGYSITGQNGSQTLTGTLNLTFNVNCKNNTAVDNSGLTWGAKCSGSNVKLYLNSGGLSIYLNNTVDDSTVSGSISSSGSINQSVTESGYTAYVTISNFSGYITGTVFK